MYNLYKVTVRDKQNNIKERYFLSTSKVMDQTEKKGSYIKVFTLLEQINVYNLEELFKRVKINYLNKANLDYYHITEFNGLEGTYYAPAIKTRPQQDTVPFAHSDPSKELQKTKLSSPFYYSLIFKTDLEKILERQIICFNTPQGLYDTYILYLHNPSALRYYHYYNHFNNDSFMSFLMVLRDITTMLRFEDKYYYYSYFPLPNEEENKLVLIGTYSKSTIKSSEGLKSWIKDDFGKSLRSSMVLLPLDLNSIKSLWTMFSNNVSTD